jgi:hypothetical protein
MPTSSQPKPVECGVSEFGEVLGELVARTPGAIGAVLSDNRDETIDTARRPERISELDVRIVGAQIGQAMGRLDRSAEVLGMRSVRVVIETEQANLCAVVLLREYLLTLLLDRQANLARAMRGFDETVDRLIVMLR